MRFRHFNPKAPHVHMPLLLASSRRMTQYPGSDCGSTCKHARCLAKLISIKKSYVGRENSPYINEGKRDKLAQGALSLPHQKMRGESMWTGWSIINELYQDDKYIPY
eukprot:1156612-Pelagomonas_calceolata.AAC.3